MKYYSKNYYPIMLPNGKKVLRKIQYDDKVYFWAGVTIKGKLFSIEKFDENEKMEIDKPVTYKLSILVSSIDDSYIVKHECYTHDKGIFVNYYADDSIYNLKKYHDVIDNKFFENVK